MSNPVLIEVTRGPLIESTHRGALAIARPDGSMLLAMGDITTPTFPRSAIKALQCILLIETGAAEKFNFDAREIALACASHTGTKHHVDLAASMLEHCGLDQRALGCGAHPPLGSGAAKALWQSGGEPTPLHNNCSGKHAGMLATALHMGEPTTGYYNPEHPVQQRVNALLREFTGLPLGNETMGTDGCSLPNWAMPLREMAKVFATFVTGEGLSSTRQAAIDEILKACWAHPELIAGRWRTDTMAMTDLPGKVFIKTGAEGVYCGGFPTLGLGFALKIDDGTTRAAAGTAMALVEHLFPYDNGQQSRKILKTWRGKPIGEIRESADLLRGLESIRP